MTTIVSIQVLRGIAALMVVMVHSFVHLNARGIIQGVPSLADAGLFGDNFVIVGRIPDG